MTGVLLLMATGCLAGTGERTGEKEEVVGLPSAPRIECGELSLKNRCEQVKTLGQEPETKAAKRNLWAYSPRLRGAC